MQRRTTTQVEMEFIEKEEVETPAELLAFSRSLVDTVHRLHVDAGLLHCDLSTGNVKWSGGQVHLIDFGRAQYYLDGTKTRHETGTRGFEAPEILNGEAHTVATDTFSVGRIILHAIEDVCGSAMKGDDKDEAKNEDNRIRRVLEGLSSRLTRDAPGSRLELVDALGELDDALIADDMSEGGGEDNVPIKILHRFSSVCVTDSPPHKMAKVTPVEILNH